MTTGAPNIPQSFAQSTEMGRVRARLGWKIFETQWGIMAFGGGHVKVLESFCGPTLDYNDLEVVKEFTKYMLDLAKKEGATYIRCNPNLVYQLRDKDGTVIDTFKSSTFSKSGWNHSGYTVGNNGQPRFYYIRDLEEPTYADAKKHFKNTVRTEIRRAEELGIGVREIGTDQPSELGEFKAAMEETASRQGFTDKTEEYYRALKEELGDKVHFMVSVLDIPKATNLVEEKIKRLEVKLSVVKKEGQRAEFQNQIDGARKRLGALKDLPSADKKAGTVIINSGVFIENNFTDGSKNNAEMVYLFGGTKSAYLNFGAVYLLQEVMMKKCYNLGIKRYNFYGVSGVFDHDDPSYGVLEFKQAFGGYIEELIGEYTLPVKKLTFRVLKSMGRV